MPFVYAIAVIIILAILIMVVMSHHPMFKMTSQTVGTIASASEREVRDENERRDETIILCTYEVAGHPYQIERILRGKKAYKFPAGRQIKVKYNPSDPQMAEMAM